MRLSWIFSCCLNAGLISEDEKIMFQKCCDYHSMKILSGDVSLKFTNHTLFLLHGLRCLNEINNNENSKKNIQHFIVENFNKLLKLQFDEQGVHQEHSLGYHLMCIKILKFLVDTGLYENKEFHHMNETISRAIKNLFYFTSPAGELWQIGDTSLNSGNLLKKYSEYFAELTSPVESQCFSFGYVAVKSGLNVAPKDGFGLFFQGAFHSATHKQHDDLTFELYELGQKLITDSGAIGYEVSERRRYVLSNRAHNTVQIDGRDFSRRTPPYGSAVKRFYRKAEGDFVILSKASHPHLFSCHYRKLIYRPKNYLKIIDRCSNFLPYKVFLHFNQDISLVSCQKGNVCFITKEGRYMYIYSDVDFDVSVYRGDYLNMMGFTSPKPAQFIPRFCLEYSVPAGKTPIFIIRR